MKSILKHFSIRGERESTQQVITTIHEGVDFKGTNLWILVFAILIACLGLNLNSPAIIIGAMLISPLMGPIMGLGLGVALNDVSLLRRATSNYLFAVLTGLIASTLYFLISPLNEAHSEILARTAPTIYDVLIAFFGGLAGVIATISTKKGNVIPGVAIATALMPPLCTAGYGLATLNTGYFFGALYLFIINTVFIALATFLTARLLRFPYAETPDEQEKKRSKQIMTAVVLMTLLPSIYFGYDIVTQTTYTQNANRFIDTEAVFPNNYLLQKNIDAKHHNITLTYGGELITQESIDAIQNKKTGYNLNDTNLTIRQGFSYLRDEPQKNTDTSLQLQLALLQKEQETIALQQELKERNDAEALSSQIFQEIQIQYPNIKSLALDYITQYTNEGGEKKWVALVTQNKKLTVEEKNTILAWLKVRLKDENVQLIVE